MSKKGWFKPLTQLYNFTSLATLFKYSPMRKDWTFEIKLKWPYLCISCNFPWYTYFNFYQLCRKLRYFTKLKDINDKNFYVLKIHLNLFEISNQVLKLENLIQIWKFFVPSENLFQNWTLKSGAMWLYSSLSCSKVKYNIQYMHIAPLHGVHVWNVFWDRTNFFQI